MSFSVTKIVKGDPVTIEASSMHDLKRLHEFVFGPETVVTKNILVETPGPGGYINLVADGED